MSFLVTCVLPNFRSVSNGLGRCCVGFNSIDQQTKLVKFNAFMHPLIECNLKCCFLVCFCCLMSFLATCILPNFRSGLGGGCRCCVGFNSVVQQTKPVKCNEFMHLLIEFNLQCCFLVCFGGAMLFLATCVLPNFRSGLGREYRGCAGFNSVAQQTKPAKCNKIMHLLIEFNLQCCFLVCFGGAMSFSPRVCLPNLFTMNLVVCDTCSHACLFFCLLACLLTCLLTCLLDCLLACPFACLLACSFACLLACLLARLPACLLACLFACLLACLLVCSLACLLACPLACLFACSFACLFALLLTCLLACQLAHSHACLITCLITCLLAYLLARLPVCVTALIIGDTI